MICKIEMLLKNKVICDQVKQVSDNLIKIKNDILIKKVNLTSILKISIVLLKMIN